MKKILFAAGVISLWAVSLCSAAPQCTGTWRVRTKDGAFSDGAMFPAAASVQYTYLVSGSSKPVQLNPCIGSLYIDVVSSGTAPEGTIETNCNTQDVSRTKTYSFSITMSNLQYTRLTSGYQLKATSKSGFEQFAVSYDGSRYYSDDDDSGVPEYIATFTCH